MKFKMMNMKKIILVIAIAFSAAGLKAQTDLIGDWELCKIVVLPADTQVVKQDDTRYIKYHFNYNNTFSGMDHRLDERRREKEIKGIWHCPSQFKTSSLHTGFLSGRRSCSMSAL